MFEKVLSDAIVNANTIAWRLQQADTLKLVPKKNATLTCDWRTAAGVRSKSHTLAALVENGGKDEII